MSLRLVIALILLVAGPALCQESKPARKANRLLGEKSPYLQQHAHNPVDWWPWCDEAFAEAKRRGVPVFLSVGYSTCHWCHVMEKESFENPEIAKLMNESFVNVKLDREERPDVDAVYMKAVMLFGRGRGGWPASIWLVPDEKIAFFAGTYFPPENFKKLILEIGRLWKSDRAALERDATNVIKILRENDPAAASEDTPPAALVGTATTRFLAMYDRERGGFGGAPKFPRTSVHRLLLLTGDEAAEKAATHSLHEMGRGGVYDQVGGGFHRYSVDAEWLVPHFEKMLYDQALITNAYLDAGLRGAGEAAFEIADDVLGCVLRDFRSPEGAFWSAYDADSGGVEGSYYVWSVRDLRKHLSPKARRLVEERFEISEHGNFHELPGGNILRVRKSWEEVGAAIELSVEKTRALWSQTREKMRVLRDERPRPGLDDKILTAWNGMMIGALARAARIRGRDDYRTAAETAATFVLQELRTKDGGLLRRWCRGEAAFGAVLRDYAFLGAGLLELFETTGDVRWVSGAVAMADGILAEFRAEDGGFYDAPAAATDLVLRTRDPYDGAVPSGNSTAVGFLLRLADATGRKSHHEAAAAALRAFRGTMETQPTAYPALLRSVDALHRGHREVIVVGDPERPETRAMRDLVSRTWLPHTIRCFVTDAQARAAEALLPILKFKTSDKGAPVAYVCRGGTCKAPARTLDELRKALED